MPRFKPVQNTSLPQVIVEQIIAQIAEGELRPGDRLPTEAEMMVQFDVGRSTLREALKSLAMLGIIETHRSAGTFVSESYTDFLSNHLNWALMFSEREMRDIMEVRLGLEGQTASLAAERATPEQKARLTRLIAAMDQPVPAVSPEQMTDYDMEFHATIAEASGNPLLLTLMHSIRNLMRDSILWGFINYRKYDNNASAHQRILDAILEGDPNRAHAEMKQHLNFSAAWILKAAEELRHQTQSAPTPSETG